MTWGIPALAAVGIAAGPMLANLGGAGRRRAAGWLLLLTLIVGVDRLLDGEGAVARMIGLCCVLLAGMKGLVYAEWAQDRRLRTPHYLVFALFWLGMDPGSFQGRRRGLAWKGDLFAGLLLTAAGAAAAWWVWRMGWRQVLVIFVPMSLGFHFGVLRILKAGLRAAGYPVRTLFPNVLETRGIGDFWGRRWNTGYSQMMQRLVGKPITRRWGEDAGLMAVFLGSGVLHEIAISLPVRAGFGLPMVYFAMHGLLTLAERRTGCSVGRLPALIAVALPLGLLFPPEFQQAVMVRCLEFLGSIDAWWRDVIR